MLSLDEKRRERLTTEWESYCDPSKGCGMACCHFNGSPCEELKWTDHKKKIGVCQVYPTRFGEHKTVAGEVFKCVPASEWIKNILPPGSCGYYKVTSVEGVPTIRGLV